MKLNWNFIWLIHKSDIRSELPDWRNILQIFEFSQVKIRRKEKPKEKFNFCLSTIHIHFSLLLSALPSCKRFWIYLKHQFKWKHQVLCLFFAQFILKLDAIRSGFYTVTKAASQIVTNFRFLYELWAYICLNVCV